MKLSLYNTDTQDDLEMTPLLGKGTTWLNSAKRKATKSAIYLYLCKV